MRYNKYLFVILLSLLFACEPEVDAIYEAPTIPVVYCLLCEQDSLNNSLILTKTIAGQRDAGKMSKILDSLYFKEAEVWLEYGREPDIQVINLQRTLSYNKEPGFFASPDQIVYHITDTLPPAGSLIKLIVKVPDLPIAFSEIRLLRPPNVVFKQYSKKIRIYYDKSWDISVGRNQWQETTLNIKYVEKFKNETQDTCLITIDKNNSPGFAGKSSGYSITGEMFKNFIVNNIIPDSTVISRKIDLIKLTVYRGDIHFKSYIDWKLFANDYYAISGYSNIENGIGLFASRSYTIRDSLELDYVSLSWMLKDPRLKKLKFHSW